MELSEEMRQLMLESLKKINEKLDHILEVVNDEITEQTNTGDN